ncbi:malto-oligosyltrehalose synthase [Streptomyces oceani]|uniref:Alpha-amylase n=1 Tax=Streptomyces oceani TaxID=1075402 RepID=A0A1E7KKB6_9ACTN|nr:malto-oligosyltrehalose synthase [Streptomyces oceani]OEV04462.1 alpha-amylase [Streptomyces oceani]
MPPSATPPAATYRLQLSPAFPFAAAEAAVPGLARLGVSHLHLSPVLTAVPGSTHGYDVTDHRTVRAELGGESGLCDLARTAHAHGLGLVLDIVPNHMAVPPDVRLNEPLWQTLRDGPDSPYARWFDIDWSAGDGRVLLPVLAGPADDEQPALRVEDGTLRYGSHVFPLRPGTAGLPLARLLAAQHYRLGWWRLAGTELNYRRFFTVSELIGVRVEDPVVFEATHRTLLRLLRTGVLDGFRVDHPDGLADPSGYLRRLARETDGRWTVVEKILAARETLPSCWPVAGSTGYDALRQLDGLFVDPVGHDELVAEYREFTTVPTAFGGEWGATVRQAAHGLLAGELAAETDRLARAVVRACAPAPGSGTEAADPDGTATGVTERALSRALRGLLAELPVYRPYAVPGEEPSVPDVRAVDAAAAAATEAVGGVRGGPEVPAVRRIRDLLLGRPPHGSRHGSPHGSPPAQEDDDEAQRRAAAHEAVRRFGQLSSALRAKAVEDTAFYRYVPLLSANEVGGDPGRPAVSPAEFHAHCARVQRDWPHTGTLLSTHDTKRSADARAALALLSECPRAWSELLAELTSPAVPPAAGTADPEATADTAIFSEAAAPEPWLAWAGWQTALALGTPDPERLTSALLKSVREAGTHTSWTEPDPEYERSVTDFVASGPCGAPARALEKWATWSEPYVRANQLGLALLQLTMPGVPELYWGTERPYRVLVDPDNRRPPDALGWPDPRPDDEVSAEKLHLTRTALRLRRAWPEAFGERGDYRPLRARGPAAEHCVAFARSGVTVTVVTRLSWRLRTSGGWRDTELRLPDGHWRELLSGRSLDGGSQPVAALLGERPVALLCRACGTTTG